MFVLMRGAKKEIKITIRLDILMRDNLLLLANADKRNLTDYIRIKLETIIEEEKKMKDKKETD